MNKDIAEIAKIIEQAFAADPICGGRFCAGTAEAAARATYAVICDRITALEAENAQLREALENAAEAMSCRDGDSAHYCLNCDNSMHGAREAVYAALQHNGDEG